MPGATITKPASVKLILLHLRLLPDAATVAPARGPLLLQIDQTPTFDRTLRRRVGDTSASILFHIRQIPNDTFQSMHDSCKAVVDDDPRTISRAMVLRVTKQRSVCHHDAGIA